MYYIKDGELKRTVAESVSIMVESESDLASLTNAHAGAIAYTAGFANMWQLNSDGEWIAIVEE